MRVQHKGFEIAGFDLNPARFLSVLTEMLASQGTKRPGQGRDILSVLKKEGAGSLLQLGTADPLPAGLFAVYTVVRNFPATNSFS